MIFERHFNDSKRQNEKYTAQELPGTLSLGTISKNQLAKPFYFIESVRIDSANEDLGIIDLDELEI